MRRLILGMLAVGCASGPIEQACDDMCDELVRSCEYEAFPTNESCFQGCLFESEEGGDVEAQADCVLSAECDTFAIVECQNDFGA